MNATDKQLAETEVAGWDSTSTPMEDECRLDEGVDWLAVGLFAISALFALAAVYALYRLVRG